MPRKPQTPLVTEAVAARVLARLVRLDADVGRRQARVDAAKTALDEAVAEARAMEIRWEAIGKALGLSRQAAEARFSPARREANRRAVRAYNDRWRELRGAESEDK